MSIDRPINVAILTGQLVKGGAEKGLHSFLAHANKARFHFTVICLNPGGFWMDAVRNTGVKVIEIPGDLKGLLRRCRYIIRLLSEVQPTILHSWNFYPTAYCAVCGRLAHIRVLLGCLRDEPEFVLRGMGWKAKVIFRSVHGFVTNSYFAKSRAGELGLKTAPMHVVHNGIQVPDELDSGKSASLFEEKWGIPQDADVLGTVGRLVPKKNLFMLLKVLKNVFASGNHGYGVIIGDGPLRDALQNEAGRIGLAERVVFTGNRDDVHELVQRFTVFCSTSSSEGLPNAVMEAMAAGVPVVATDVGGIRELIDDGDSGFIVPSEDVDAMVKKVSLLLDSPELRRKIGQTGREKMMREFTIERMVNALQDVYETCLAERSLKKPSLLRRIVGT